MENVCETETHYGKYAHCLGGSGGTPVRTPQFSHFRAVFWKIGQNRMLAQPGGSAPPPTGNPGSAPDVSSESMEHFKVIYSKVLLIFYQQDFPVSIKFFRHDKFWKIWK